MGHGHGALLVRENWSHPLLDVEVGTRPEVTTVSLASEVRVPAIGKFSSGVAAPCSFKEPALNHQHTIGWEVAVDTQNGSELGQSYSVLGIVGTHEALRVKERQKTEHINSVRLNLLHSLDAEAGTSIRHPVEVLNWSGATINWVVTPVGSCRRFWSVDRVLFNRVLGNVGLAPLKVSQLSRSAIASTGTAVLGGDGRAFARNCRAQRSSS